MSDNTLGIWLRGVPAPQWTRRPLAKDDLRAKARELRLAGWTYPRIDEVLGVSKSSVSLWVRDLPCPELEPGRRALAPVAAAAWWRKERQRREIQRQQELSAVAESIGPLTERELLIVGAVAYWAEGGKRKPWNRQERLSFCNSDPDMIRLFCRWLKLLGVTQDQMRVSVQIHESADVTHAERFWADVVGIPLHALAKTTLKRHNPKPGRKNVGDRYVGCCRIDVRQSKELYRRAEGVFCGTVAGSVEVPRTANLLALG